MTYFVLSCVGLLLIFALLVLIFQQESELGQWDWYDWLFAGIIALLGLLEIALMIGSLITA